ncbi:hypothetical protein TRFO_01426 [Tritrichomonas foetus]|uniref:HMG box domain-containing protein n=1 Tax=Tritrichomonas foetus TaxID=1144522 RepID=A0A1J4JXP9_9EUKA|nr:hypothetical protein TRFO_01426 [Tritrichomonas foetus]|eukprot:OHT03771.1 hypothetical protein TRFO_01426 [Tritrichomonas foetus]
MRSNTQQNLNQVESSVWQLYSQQRTEELRQDNPTMTENDRQNVAWYEFLQLKWSLIGANENNSITKFDNALREYDFGPDLRGSSRHLFNISKTIKIKKVKNHTIKSHLRGARDGHKPGITHNSSYTYFVHKRMNELKQQGASICVKTTIPGIAKEWSSLSDEQRIAFDKEWRQYCQSLKNENGDQRNTENNNDGKETDKEVSSEPPKL